MKILPKISLLIIVITLLSFTIPIQAAPLNTSGNPAPILLWSASTGSTETMSDNAAKVACVGDGEYIAVGYGSGVVEFRDRQGAILWRWQSPHSYYTVLQVVVSRNGEYTGVVLYDPLQNNMGELDYFDRAGNHLWNKSMKDPFGFESLSGNGNAVALTDRDRISFFNAAGNLTGATVLEISPWTLSLSDDGSTAVVPASSWNSLGDLYVIRMNGTVLWSAPNGPRRPATAISRDGRFLASTGQNTLQYFNIRGDQLWSFNSSPEFTDVAISADGAFVSASSQYYLRYFNASGSKLWQYEIPTLPTKPGPYIDHLSMSDDGTYISTSKDDGSILFFNREGKLLWQNESPSWIVSTSLSQNGKYLAIGTEEEFMYFDTGIGAPSDDTVPTMLVTTLTNSPAPTPRSSVPIFAAIVAVCAGVLLWGEMKRQR